MIRIIVVFVVLLLGSVALAQYGTNIISLNDPLPFPVGI